MSLYDLIIRHGAIAAETGVERADLAIAEGRIVEIAPEITATGRRELDATGLHIFPGMIDAHVHFDEPGRTDWEGFSTGSAAFAAGGGTTYFDMPLNAHPPTVDRSAFDQKLAAAQASSLTDFALWGGIVPGNADRLEDLADRGVVGFKAFMCKTSTEDFPQADDLTLYEGMGRAARLGCLVAVHAENDQIARGLAHRARNSGRTGVRDYLLSRPVIAEVEAIERAILFAEETGCSLHIVHVSSGAGVVRVAAARQRGVDVSCETCAHYLALTGEDMERLGAVAKCAPPLRSDGEREKLWQHIFDGTLTMVTSDHSPALPEMRNRTDFFEVWGGMTECQSTLRVLLTEGYEARKLPLKTLTSLVSANVARRFHLLPAKGRIAVDADADLALVDLTATSVLSAGELLYRHRQSAYIGRRLRGRIVETLLRGQSIVRDGQVLTGAIGRLVRPARRQSVTGNAAIQARPHTSFEEDRDDVAPAA